MRRHLLQTTSRITALAKSGNVSAARKVFDEMPQRDAVAWNAMISGYCYLGFYQQALLLFSNMGCSNMKPDHFTYTAALSACSGLKNIRFGRMFHCLLVISGWNSLLPVNNALIDMYGKCSRTQEANAVFLEMGLRNEVSWCSLLFAWLSVGFLDVSFRVFFSMPRRVVVSWNTMISGYAKWGEAEMCLDLFKRMLEDSCSPDEWTLSSIMNACGEMDESCYGRMVHGLVIANGWNTAVEVYNSTLSFYVKFGDENEVLMAVEAAGVSLSKVSWNAIIDAYMKMGNIEKARFAFQRTPEKNTITWASMIAGYMRNGHGECAMQCFADFIQSGIRPDDTALGAVLHACSAMATLGHGRTIHGYVVKSCFHSYTYIGNGLVNMYAKCGDIHDSYMAFGDILDKDLVSWNTMLFGFGLHGQFTQALSIFDEMVISGINPDKVTFIGILMTCSHLGLIEEGLRFFDLMTSRYGLSPDINHVGCTIDMLGRSGDLEKAKEVMNKYVATFNGKVSSLGALLGSYSCQSELTMGEGLAKELRILKPNDEMSYVLLSNLYCASGQWKQAETLRKMMVKKGVRKMPGCSWIEVMNRVAVFVAGSNSSTPHIQQVHLMLHLLEYETRSCSCIDSLFE